MTTISAPIPAARGLSRVTSISHFSLPAALIGVWRQWRTYRELRTLESLPEGLLKDIGWPSSDRNG